MAVKKLALESSVRFQMKLNQGLGLSAPDQKKGTDSDFQPHFTCLVTALIV